MSKIFVGLPVVILCIVGMARAVSAGGYEAKGKRDPFVPLVTSEGQRVHPPGGDEEVALGVTGLTLQGIVFEPGADSYAIINGQIVRSHEDIEGIEVLKIEPDSVTLLVEGKAHRLTLHQSTEETGTP